MHKTDYTTAEWKLREQYYIDELTKLNIPEEPTTKEILNLTSKLDKLYTIAAFELANLKRKEARFRLDLKNAEAELFNILKKQELTAGNKVTENDVKGIVKNYLMNNNIQGYNNDIYSLIKAVMDRLIFAEQVVKTITEKKASIIAATSMLKIENSFSGAREREVV